IELRAAERFDAAGLVDHVNRKLGGGDAADADLGHAAGGGIERADIDGVGGPAAERDCAERAGRQGAAGSFQEFAAAPSLRQRVTISALAIIAFPVIEDGLLAMVGHAVPPDAHPAAEFCLAGLGACYWGGS